MAAPRRRDSSTAVLLLLIGCALLIGAAASAFANTPPSSGSPNAGGGAITVPSVAITFAFLAGVASLIGFLVYRRMTSETLPIPGRALVFVLVAILIACVFVVIGHYYVPGWNGGGGSGGPGGNSTGTQGNQSHNTSVLNGTGGIRFGNFVFPPWTLFVVVVAIALSIAVLATPQARDFLFAGGRHRSKGRLQEGIAAAREALGRAVASLESGTDPRATIIALYADFLGRIAPLVGDLEPSTPEEIRTQHLERLGLRPEAATDLTRLFEEARYSSHPMGPESADRALDVVRRALADLSARLT
jgi:hypothetical protein